MQYKWEQLDGGGAVATSSEHGFGHDALLLAEFYTPKPGDVACDLGSGCGIIPLKWFDIRGESTGGPRIAYAVDIMPGAAAQLEESVRKNGLEGRLVPLLADLRELKALNLPKMDLVTCNPPYQAAGTGKRSREAAAAFARHEGESSCSLSDVCEAAARLLRFGGRFCVCHRPRRLSELFAAMCGQNIEPKRLRTVHKDAKSPPWLVLAEGRLGGRPGLIYEAPLMTP